MRRRRSRPTGQAGESQLQQLAKQIIMVLGTGRRENTRQGQFQNGLRQKCGSAGGTSDRRFVDLELD